jgi:hypothetical protein
MHPGDAALQYLRQTCRGEGNGGVEPTTRVDDKPTLDGLRNNPANARPTLACGENRRPGKKEGQAWAFANAQPQLKATPISPGMPPGKSMTW